MRGPIVARIGRALTPAEDTLSYARECDDFAEYIGRNLFRARVGGEWVALLSEEQSFWIDKAIGELEKQADNEPGPPTPEPPTDGGEPMVTAA